MADPQDDRGRDATRAPRPWPRPSTSPSGPSAATSRRCRRPASPSTTTAWTGARCGASCPGYKQKLTQSFSLSELAALYFGKNLLSFLGGAPFSEDLESAFAKIKEALPPRSLPYLARVQDLFAARPQPAKDYSRKKEVIAGLVEATLHQKQAQVAYYSFKSKQKKRTSSIPIASSTTTAGSTSTPGPTSTARSEPSRWSASRRSRCSTPASRCRRTSTSRSSPEAAFGITGGEAQEVLLEVDAKVADYVRERVWHESQQVEERPDGSLFLRMKVTPGFELRSWIKGFLPHVRVLEPAGLRQEILAEIEAARSLFLPR